MTSPAVPPQVVIGVDVGTTAAKVAAFGVGAPWRHVAVREYPLLEPHPGWQVQDPETVAAATLAALADAVSATRGAEVLALSVSTAMHGLIGLDAAMTPLTPLLTWADARSAPQAAALRASGDATWVHATTGTPVHSMTPLTKLMWFTEHEPELAGRVRWWVDLKGYVLWRLTGTLATELSSASGTALLDARARTWSEPAARLAGVSVDRLPPVLPTTHALGLSDDVALRVGLAPGTTVVVGAADGPLGNLGTGALGDGVVGLSLGTSGAARMLVPAPPDVLDPALFCYALTSDAWVVGGAVSNGGMVVRWAGSALAPDLQGPGDDDGGPSVDERVLELASRVPAGSDGLVMVPYLLAERAPLWDPTQPGAYLGLRRGHTRAHLVRAAVEGVALQLGLIVDRLDRLAPGGVSSVRATGGAFRAALWREVLAAVVDRPFSTVGAAEGSALGAAALGLYALGRADTLAGALDLVQPPEESAAELVTVGTELVAAYAAARVRVPELVESLTAVGRLFSSPR